MNSPAGKLGTDVFQIPPLEALKAVTAQLAELARLTGDVPTTLLSQQDHRPYSPVDGIDNVMEKQNTTISITELHGADSKHVSPKEDQTGKFQHNVLAKRFFSKKAPPISLEEYLLRLHKYCPMSTAVYLAASLYITKMVVTEKALFVTPRNVHRLVLAGLRVAMKALEDLTYPHSRFARVGGVTERELTRLEITFCFLMDFALRVDAHALTCQVSLLKGLPYEDMIPRPPPRSPSRDSTSTAAPAPVSNEIVSSPPPSQ
ncbi:cyclin-domain-containing protein [Talaromyces proteolyticus]|uniref:Cyclin-domain-containing protein n=1 Tax=Talaromyces proteolyticus TaxID=1131652 RepID=A0AAD4KSS7_9EURO|nr:cyclin-domain-containing protein [Talaromyces proteolyticus]KAH8695921.1 cyclin-domain-containing protein [Talaromyces proteolyticus]